MGEQLPTATVNTVMESLGIVLGFSEMMLVIIKSIENYFHPLKKWSTLVLGRGSRQYDQNYTIVCVCEGKTVTVQERACV